MIHHVLLSCPAGSEDVLRESWSRSMTRSGRVSPDHPYQRPDAGQQLLVIADAVERRLHPAHHLLDLAPEVVIAGTSGRAVRRLRIREPGQVSGHDLPGVRDGVGQRRSGPDQITLEPLDVPPDVRLAPVDSVQPAPQRGHVVARMRALPG
jgi:hypothetical protein